MVHALVSTRIRSFECENESLQMYLTHGNIFITQYFTLIHRVPNWVS